MSSRSQRLLERALAHYDASADAVAAVPDSFESSEAAVACMRGVLSHDLHVALRTPLEDRPDELLHHPVDLGSAEPGIVCSTRPRVETLRRGAAVPAADEADEPARARVVDRPVATALRLARRAEESSTRRLQRAAQRQLKQESERAARAAETTEQRAERLSAQRAKREETKRKKAAAEEEETEEKKGTEPSEAAPTRRRRAPDADAACVAACDARLPARAPPKRYRGLGPSALVHASPVPGDRHLTALDAAQPSDDVRDAVLRGVPSPAVVLVQGPPGTGKSRDIVQRLLRTDEYGRALVCAPSNVAVAGLYARILATPALRDACSLCMPPERVPPGTPVASTDPSRRIVCATVSSRAGSVLHAHEFDLVLLDEAAQCSEACTWTLLRPEVRRLVLVGDVHQLPSVTTCEEARRCGHGRSMMERLSSALGYPTTSLRVQHRMHAQISAFPNRYFYDSMLVDAHECADPRRDAVAYACVRVRDSREERDGTSVVNWPEARAACEVAARYCVADDDAARGASAGVPRVVILCPYRAQCRAVLSLAPECAVHTIDSFQGREASVVVLTTCRVGPDTEGGFWSDARRLNVALTRAKRTMVVVGSFDWRECACLAAMADDARARGLVRDHDDAVARVPTKKERGAAP